MANVELEGAVKKFGEATVIHGVDLQLEHGEFVVFVGPSGCGKSTLLRMIAGLEELSGGRLLIGDRDVSNVAAVDRGIAMVFQSYALYPHMTVEQNMGFGLRMNGVPADEIKRKVDEAAATLQLSALLDRKPKNLSGGQRQRVAIGRAIVRAPDVFLFDEPLSNLDAELRVEMRLQIARLHKQLDATMIYVTHDQVEAMTMADKIVVLRLGKVEQVGSPLELYNHPDNLFVAGFLGSPKMNLLEGVLKEPGESYSVVELADGDLCPLPMDTTRSQPDSKVTVGIRPEDMLSTDGDISIALQVDVVERLGGSTYIYGRCNGLDNFVVEREGRDTTEVGQTQSLKLPAAKCYLFDEQGLAYQRRMEA